METTDEKICYIEGRTNMGETEETFFSNWFLVFIWYKIVDTEKNLCTTYTIIYTYFW
jgi:hypothetical protein